MVTANWRGCEGRLTQQYCHDLSSAVHGMHIKKTRPMMAVDVA
jgi:hypothetical protein